MPTVVPETDAFAATVSRPNNGEPADGASILAFESADASRDRYLYNRHRTRIYDVTRAGYSANANKAADARAAIQQAIDDASGATGGGDVYLPGKFRCDGGLTMRPGVNLRGIPGITELVINHATDAQQTWNNGSSHSPFTIIENILFDGMVDNTGAAISNPFGTDVRVKYVNCGWNEDGSARHLKGRLALIQGGASAFEFEECYLRAVGDANIGLLSGVNAELCLKDNRLFMPATYTASLVDIDDGQFRAYANRFDVTEHLGSANIININGSGYWHKLSGNHFTGALSSGSCLVTSSGLRITETGSTFDTVNPYNISGTLALGSELTLANALATTTFSSVFTCATGYRAQAFKVNSGSPSITLPGILFIGQEFDLVVTNAVGPLWTGIGIAGGAGVLATNIPAGWTVSYHWRALDPKNLGTPTWVLQGDPSSPFIVP